jgi:hypothetical protein
MGRWETKSELAADVEPAAVWRRAYAEAEAWPRWNRENVWYARRRRT